MTRKKLVSHEKLVIEQLKDAKFAAAYLNENWNYRGPKRMRLLMQAFHRISLGRGISRVAKESGISRRALHKVFSAEGNPRLSTLLTLLDALGISVQFAASKKGKGLSFPL